MVAQIVRFKNVTQSSATIRPDGSANYGVKKVMQSSATITRDCSANCEV